VRWNALGASGIEVSALALGSWQTYERISPEAGAAVLRAAREAGVTFLEVARYNDYLGTAPIPTGYSEVVFGELFRASGWPREEVVIGEKLWWEFEQTASEELDASLQRLGIEAVDLLYSDPPPAELELSRVVASVTDLIGEGRIRAWGVVNWTADRVLEAARIADAQGIPAPCAVQLPYSLIRRDWVEDPAMDEALEACGASLIPSNVLAGGALTGKYARGETGRLSGQVIPPDVPGTEAAIRFALSHPRTASVLVGCTSPAQVRENAAAVG
jgi:aryl-alcohol dehydrogenase-like predicted oxidoreductase